jgi:hypothetical protein
VAGLLEAGGRIAFLYGEITGYWLSWASAPGSGVPAERVKLGVQFLTRSWSHPTPPSTRQGRDGDWRNRALFSFDLAVMLRGLADVIPVAGRAACQEAAVLLSPWLERLVTAEGLLAACLNVVPGPLPARWSTKPGPFQSKTAACLLRVPRCWLPPAVTAAAAATLSYWAGRAVEHSELHALLYALEGSLIAGLPVEATSLTDVVCSAGRLPEDLRDPTVPPRADVLAQAIRILVLTDPKHPALPVLVRALLRCVVADGSVRFRAGESAANTWCALFAHQALSWLAHGGAHAARLI